MTGHYDEWFKKAVLYDSYLSSNNTVDRYEDAKVQEYEDWFETKNTEIENAIEKRGEKRG
jgi:hypothetical protein